VAVVICHSEFVSCYRQINTRLKKSASGRALRCKEPPQIALSLPNSPPSLRLHLPNTPASTLTYFPTAINDFDEVGGWAGQINVFETQGFGIVMSSSQTISSRLFLLRAFYRAKLCHRFYCMHYAF
jgi:hypothetical protein